MDAVERVLAAPGSEAARRALLAAWEAARDPRAPLLADQLALREHRLRGALGSPEAQALYRRVNLAVARATPLAAQLERTYGARPWLDEPEDAASWPPDRDELAVTP